MPLKPKGTVGVYFVRFNEDRVLETLVSRRSSMVAHGKEKLATTGGVVDKADALDSRGVMQKTDWYLRGMKREVREEVGIDIDSLEDAKIWELTSTPRRTKHTFPYHME